jgi:hypothetical protein
VKKVTLYLDSNIQARRTSHDLMKTTLTLARLVLSETVRHFFWVESNYLVDLYGITIPSTKFNEG